MSRGNRANAPPGYHHLNDLCLFSERTAAPPPLQELPDVLSLGHVEKEWQGMLEPSKLRLMRKDNGDRVVTKEYDGILPEVVDHIKSMHCNHPDWCIIGVRACIVTDSCVPARPAGAAKPAKVIIVQDYMELHSFKDILPPPQLPQSPPPVSEAACAWVAKCILRALRYIGSCRHAVHCNIRPSSILLDRQGNVRVTDIAILHEREARSTLSFSFIPEEFVQMERTKYQCSERHTGTKANSSTDIWSLGMCLMEMYLGHYVYDTPNSRDRYTCNELIDMIEGAEPDDDADEVLDCNMVPLKFVDLLENGRYPDDPPPPPISPLFASFLRHCLNPTSSMRKSAQTLMDDPWVKNAQQCDLTEWLRSHVHSSVPKSMQQSAQEARGSDSDVVAVTPMSPSDAASSRTPTLSASDGSQSCKRQRVGDDAEQPADAPSAAVGSSSGSSGRV